MQSAVIGGDWLVVTWTGMEEIAEFIVASTEPGRRPGTLEPAHGLVSAFDATVILLQPVVEIAARAMAYVSAQFSSDRPRVAVVSVGRDAGRGDAGDCRGRAEERLGSGHVACLAQHHVYQDTGAIDGAIEVDPAALDLEIGFINLPAPAHLATPTATQIICQGRREFGFPVPYGLVTEHDAADQEHFAQVA